MKSRNQELGSGGIGVEIFAPSPPLPSSWFLLSLSQARPFTSCRSTYGRIPPCR